MLQFIYFYFVLRFSNLLYLSLSDLILASDREGIENPFIALGASVWLFVQVHRLETCVYLLLYWYLGSQTKGNTYLYFAASPFPLQGKNQRKLKKLQTFFKWSLFESTNIFLKKGTIFEKMDIF